MSNCNECAFWRPNDPGARLTGECRKSAPRGSDGASGRAWPNTDWNDWCGDLNQFGDAKVVGTISAAGWFIDIYWTKDCMDSPMDRVPVVLFTSTSHPERGLTHQGVIPVNGHSATNIFDAESVFSDEWNGRGWRLVYDPAVSA